MTLEIKADVNPEWLKQELSKSKAKIGRLREREARLRAQLEHLLEKYPDERKVLAEFGYEQEPTD
jgi:hypothetical protein